jgi:lysozyme
VHKGNCDGSDASEQEFLEGITEDRAHELLRSDIAVAERAVNDYVTVPLTQSQFDALVSFCV